MSINQQVAEEAINAVNKYRSSAKLRKQRFIQNKLNKGYTHMSSTWILLDYKSTEQLKKHLRQASNEELKEVLAYFLDKHGVIVD